MDEAAIALDPTLRKCWTKRGQQRRIHAAVGKPPAHQIFGGFDWQDGTIAWTLSKRRNGDQFVHWLEHLMVNCYPTEQVVLILDNASFHHSSAARAAISLYESRLLVIFLPPYAPNLNPIERYWRHLKDKVCAHKLYASMDVLRDAIVKELQCQNDTSYQYRYRHMC